jgi:exodeoxyribonuclease VII large subunit
MERALHASTVAVNALAGRLHALSPLAVLDRGYALVLSREGALIRSTTQLAPGDALITRLADGSFTGHVETIAPNPPRRGKKGNRSQP